MSIYLKNLFYSEGNAFSPSTSIIGAIVDTPKLIANTQIRESVFHLKTS